MVGKLQSPVTNDRIVATSMTIHDIGIRDIGPYSTRNTSKGALILEAGEVFQSLAGGASISEIRDRVLNGGLLWHRTLNTRKRIWDALNYRYFSYQIPWLIEAFKRSLAQGPQNPEFVSLLYLLYALRDRLTYDFVTHTLWGRWEKYALSVGTEDLLDFLDSASESQSQIKRWSESSRKKLAHSVLAALRDFGLLVSKYRKRMVRPTLPLNTAETMARILMMEGVRGSDVLQDSIWRLFLLHQEEVAEKLASLAQHRQIDFERVGNTVVLNTPSEWTNET